MKKNKNICLIVLNYNDFETTSKFLLHHANYEDIFKIVVVDNSSTDNSFFLLKKFESEKIDVIQTSYNGGYAFGNNYGIKYAMSKYEFDYFVISNPDVNFDDDTLTILRNILEKENNIAQIAPTMTSSKMRTQNISWKLPSFWTNLKELFIPRSKTHTLNYLNLCSGNENGKYVDVISGAFFMIKKEIFTLIELFDERTFLYGEENILAYKIKKIGLRNFIVTNKEYFHFQEKSIDKEIKSQSKKFKYLFESTKIYHKYYLKISLVQKLLYNFLWYIRYLLLMIIKKIK